MNSLFSSCVGSGFEGRSRRVRVFLGVADLRRRTVRSRQVCRCPPLVPFKSYFLLCSQGNVRMTPLGERRKLSYAPPQCVLPSTVHTPPTLPADSSSTRSRSPDWTVFSGIYGANPRVLSPGSPSSPAAFRNAKCNGKAHDFGWDRDLTKCVHLSPLCPLDRRAIARPSGFPL